MPIFPDSCLLFVLQEVGECLESGLYTDLMIRCKGGQTLHAHKLVLSAASPFLRMVCTKLMPLGLTNLIIDD